MTVENLYWVLKSLRKDEMTPSDRAVMDRMKECYGLYISEEEWQKTVNKLV